MAVADTKERILDVSERLFADSGFAKTSLRDITSEAGVNLAAVNYHFGSKEALLEAILERRFRPINDKRIVMLDELEAAASSKGPDLEDILTALLEPPFHAWAEAEDRGQKLLKLVGQIHGETNEEIRAAFVGQFDQIFERFNAALGKALPTLEPAEVTRRMHLVVGAMAHTMIWGEEIMPRAPHGPHDANQLLDSLIQFAAAGMAAPAPVEVGVRPAGRRKRP